MAKQGMKRPDETRTREKNSLPPVPELQGRTKHTKQQAAQILPGIDPFFPSANPPIPTVYPVIDTDPGRDNVENDLTAADRQDL